MCRGPLILLLPLLAGCAGGTSDRGVHLDLLPVVATSQGDLFRAVDTLVLEVRLPGQDARRYELGVPEEDTSFDVKGLPDLEPGTELRLLGFAGGGTDVEDLVAYGTTGVLEDPQAEDALDVFVAGVDEIITFSAMAEASSGAAVAATGTGGFVMAGGTPYGQGSGSARADVLAWRLVPPAAGFAQEPLASLPETSDDWGDEVNRITGRCDATASRLLGEHDDAGKILIAGGWDHFLEGPSVTAQAMLLDPATGAVETVGELRTGRSMAVAVPLASGEVVFFGGFGYDDLSGTASFVGTAEIYEPLTRSFEYASERLADQLVWGAGAPLDSETAMYCGGLRYGQTWGTEPDCWRIRYGVVVEAASLPLDTDVGLIHPAMVQVASGQVLVTGGAEVEGDVSSGADIPATRNAWLYDASEDRWAEVSPMNVARAGHALAVLPGGKVLAAGGTDEVTAAGMAWGDALACAEVYDVATDTWTSLDGCQDSEDVGALPVGMVLPAVAVDALYGALIYGGFDDADDAIPHFALFTPNPLR